MVVICGVGLMLYGAGLALRSALLLSGRGRPQRGPRPTFVIAGPYRRTRNPLLSGLILVAVGGALFSQSGGRLLVASLLGVSGHLWVTLHEEPRLRNRFGLAYVTYLDRVPRWCPGARSRPASS